MKGKCTCLQQYSASFQVTFDLRIKDESDLLRWRSIKLNSVPQPSSLTVVDVTGNGLNDRTSVVPLLYAYSCLTKLQSSSPADRGIQ